MRIMMKLKVNENFQLLEIIYKWSNLAVERAFGASLPIYWLLRKEHSRAYARRRIYHFLHLIGNFKHYSCFVLGYIQDSVFCLAQTLQM